MADTVQVTFDHTGETRAVEVTSRLAPIPSREISSSQQAQYHPGPPNWRRILPDYDVQPVVGGFYATRRR